MTCSSAAGNRNAHLAFHFGEDDAPAAARARAHVESCPECRQYLATLEQVGHALGAWDDERPPAGMAERVLARAVRAPQPPPLERAHRAPAAGALPLLGLLPVMAALVMLIRILAAWLPALSFWPRLEEWPALQPIVPFAAATAAVLAIGGLATLAAAPALMLETRR
jgi:hypothetical protein